MSDWTQGQLEAFLRAERELRHGLNYRAPTAVAGVLVDLLKQAQKAGVKLSGDDLKVTLEVFAQQVRGYDLQGELTAVEQHGLFVRAAARVGLVDYTESAIDAMPPHQVKAEYKRIEALFTASLEVPKN